MSSKYQVAALIGALVSSVNAHGHLAAISVDGVAFTAYDPSFQYQTPAPEVIEWSNPEALDNGFVSPDMYTDVTKIACHKDATAGAKVATVKAGGSVEITWTTWPESHVGPVIDYLAAVTDATTTTSKDLDFFKIGEAGYEGGEWAATKLIKNNQTWSVTIPENIKAGDYVLRHEIIALHSAGDAGGAQNYPKCINLKVEGSGTETPTGESADKLYTPTDAGILVNIYSGDLSGYKVPGPALYSGASSGSGSSDNGTATPVATTSAAATSAATSAATATSSIVVQNNAVSSAAATPTSAEASAVPTQSGSAGTDEKEFTLDSFIAWLEEKAGNSTTTTTKARRHSRAFRA